MKRYRLKRLPITLIAVILFIYTIFRFGQNPEKIRIVYNNIKRNHESSSSTLYTSSTTSSSHEEFSSLIISERNSKYHSDRPATSTRKVIITKASNKISTVSNRDTKFCTWIPEKKPLEIPFSWKNYCPQKHIVTIMQFGRLGNQMWEYAAVWIVAKNTNRDPFIPSCVIQTLEKVFKNLTAIPPLKYIENCNIKYRYLWPKERVGNQGGSLVLPLLAQIPELIVPHLKEVLQLFHFHDYLTQKSQDILRRASKGVRDTVYVSVHVRRTDYLIMLKFMFNITVLEGDFFIRQMNYFRNKYSRVLFVILSDDPDWCERELSANDTVVVRENSPEQDLSLMASCNHSILDYGTFGMWGAIFAGGETLLYDLPLKSFETDMAQLMPNWRVVA